MQVALCALGASACDANRTVHIAPVRVMQVAASVCGASCGAPAEGITAECATAAWKNLVLHGHAPLIMVMVLVRVGPPYTHSFGL